MGGIGERILLCGRREPEVRRLRVFLPWNEGNGVACAGCPAYPAAETARGIDVDPGKRRRIELGAELALTDAGLAAIALVPIHLADVLCPEETRSASLLNVPLVGAAVPVTVA